MSSSLMERFRERDTPTRDRMYRDSQARAKTVMTVNRPKTFLTTFADWVEMVSLSGYIYYYNK